MKILSVVRATLALILYFDVWGSANLAVCAQVFRPRERKFVFELDLDYKDQCLNLYLKSLQLYIGGS